MLDGMRNICAPQFQHDSDCRAIIMSNGGSTGLNLQAANSVINVDLPWNPAVLEQRIARAHRMGQKRFMQVYLMRGSCLGWRGGFARIAWGPP